MSDRFILHGKILNGLQFKKEHTKFHHSYFTHDQNVAQSWLDINRIFLRPLDIFAVLSLNFVICLGLSLLTGKDVAVIIFCGGVFYVLIYETIHGVCHANQDFNSSCLSAIINHHKKHHDKSRMENTNLAIVFPVIDKLFGSYND